MLSPREIDLIIAAQLAGQRGRVSEAEAERLVEWCRMAMVRASAVQLVLDGDLTPSWLWDAPEGEPLFSRVSDLPEPVQAALRRVREDVLKRVDGDGPNRPG